MKCPAYYNENDPKTAAWLRELIKSKLIAEGEVDERSIEDVDPTDLEGFGQCHFFAGIGGWSYALRLAGWPDDRQVWTGSCPCQPLSCAGQRKGHADERHLWPAFYSLIDQRRPAIAFGEQVASKDGREWLAGVRADLEGIGYAVGASDLCAASVGAPHRRQRIYWVANARCSQRRESSERRDNDKPEAGGRVEGASGIGECSQTGQLGDSEISGKRSLNGKSRESNRSQITIRGSSLSDGVAECRGCGVERNAPLAPNRRHAERAIWSRFEIVQCRDGKARRFEPESFPLADGIPGRVALLRGYGNAINPQTAAEFIQAAEEALA